MAITDIEDKISEIIDKNDKNNFIYDFLGVYDIPKATVTKLRKGINNLADDPNEVYLKNKLYYKQTDGNPMQAFSDVKNKVDALILIYLLKSANNHTRSAITSLFEMHEAVSFHLAGMIDENNEEFQQSLVNAYHYATQTQIDADNVDDRLKLIVVKLLLLAKTAHEYFSAEFSKRSNEVEMLLRQMCFEIMDDVEEIA